MKWNNGIERAKFEREQAILLKQYKSVGMTDYQIRAMREADKRAFNGNRREAEHTLRFDNYLFDGTDDKCVLYEKFGSAFAVEPDLSRASRYSWIEEIGNESLAKALKRLPQSYLEILTMIVMDDMTQTEIATAKGVSQQYVSQIFGKIKKNFEKLLVKSAFSSAT